MRWNITILSVGIHGFLCIYEKIKRCERTYIYIYIYIYIYKIYKIYNINICKIYKISKIAIMKKKST